MNKKILSCDWGTSAFRLRLVDAQTGELISQSHSGEGIANTYAQWKKAGAEEKERMGFYLSVLQKHGDKLVSDADISAGDIPIIISGMASSSIGMLELPYTNIPFALTGQDLQIKEIKKTVAFPHDIILISGATNGKDVMRGEETQLIGCAGEMIGKSQVFIFPGTHSKHIVTQAGKATSVETYMTGEFFELLSNRGILSDSVSAGGDIETAENKAAFEHGVKESGLQNLLHSSFGVRTNQLFGKYSKSANYFYLSGLLIGTELHQLLIKENDSITIVGDKKLEANYLFALQLLKIKCKVELADDTVATVKGQLIIYKRVCSHQLAQR